MRFWRSYALSLSSAAFAAALAGCGGADPGKEFAAGLKSWENKDFKRAKEHYERGLEADPDNVDALLMLAQIEFVDGKASRASDILAKAAGMAGDDPDVVELRAQFAYHAKDWDLAAKLYRRLADDDTLDGKFRAKGWAGLGVIDYISGDLAKSQRERDLLCARARTKFLRAIRCDRTAPSPHYHLGRLYRDSYHYSRPALDEFKKYTYLEKNDDYRLNRVQREFIKEIQKDINDANAARAVRVAAGGREACANLLKQADSKFRANRITEAKNLYAEAMKKDGQSLPAAAGLARSLAALAKRPEDFKAAFKAYNEVCKMDLSKDNFLKAGSLARKARSHAAAAEIYSTAMAYYPGDAAVVNGLVQSLRDCSRNDLAAEYQLYANSLGKGK